MYTGIGGACAELEVLVLDWRCVHWTEGVFTRCKSIYTGDGGFALELVVFILDLVVFILDLVLLILDLEGCMLELVMFMLDSREICSG